MKKERVLIMVLLHHQIGYFPVGPTTCQRVDDEQNSEVSTTSSTFAQRWCYVFAPPPPKQKKLHLQKSRPLKKGFLGPNGISR